MKKKGVIFDMDGLLFDTERIFQKAWIREAELRGFKADPGFQVKAMGVNGEDLLSLIEETYPGIDAGDYLEKTVARVREMVKEELPEKPGIHEILPWLKEQRIRIGLASASSPESIHSHLSRSGILQYFDAVVSSRQVPRGKPAPDVFLEAARQIGLRPEDCYVLEDGINGIRGALAAGCSAIMIPDLAEPLPEFYSQCAAILPSLQEALRLMQEGRL